jgi:hypothetical protein
MPEQRKIGKFMTAVRQADSPSGKTQVWRILDRDGGEICGVAWHGPWRQYVTVHGAAYADDTIFNNACHRDLATFLEQLNREQKEQG